MEEDYRPFLSSSQDETDKDLLDSKVDFDSLIAELRDLESQKKLSNQEMFERLLALRQTYERTDVTDREDPRYPKLMDKTKVWFGPELSKIFDQMHAPLAERWLLGRVIVEINRSCGPTELFSDFIKALALITPEATARAKKIKSQEKMSETTALFLMTRIQLELI